MTQKIKHLLEVHVLNYIVLLDIHVQRRAKTLSENIVSRVDQLNSYSLGWRKPYLRQLYCKYRIFKNYHGYWQFWEKLIGKFREFALPTHRKFSIYIACTSSMKVKLKYFQVRTRLLLLYFKIFPAKVWFWIFFNSSVVGTLMGITK